MFDFLKKPDHFTIEQCDHSVWIPYRKRVVYLKYRWIPFRVKLIATKGTHIFDQIGGGFCQYKNSLYTESAVLMKVNQWLKTAPIRSPKPEGVTKHKVK